MGSFGAAVAATSRLGRFGSLGERSFCLSGKAGGAEHREVELGLLLRVLEELRPALESQRSFCGACFVLTRDVCRGTMMTRGT